LLVALLLFGMGVFLVLKFGIFFVLGLSFRPVLLKTHKQLVLIGRIRLVQFGP
jgi:hypothetical protein